MKPQRLETNLSKTKKIKILYFTIVNVGIDENGGALCCRNHIRRLDADPEIDLFVIIASDPSDEPNVISFFKNHKINGRFIGFKNSSNISPKNFIKKLFPIPFEECAERQQHVNKAIFDEVQKTGANILVIDFLPSVLFCSEALKIISKKVLITLNREYEMYREILNRTTMPLGDKFKSLLKSARMWHFEQSTFQRMDKIIALSPADLPTKKGVYITSYFDRKPQQWKPNSSRTIFFVGNINHYPNAEAVFYIVTKLAPQLIKILPEVRFKIIGTSSNDVAFSHPAVDFLGKSNAQEVESNFLNCQLFICPVRNTFGIKFKMAEALSYGTPILASSESLLGFPYLKDQPFLTLVNPDLDARTIASIMQDESKTRNLAMTANSQHCEFIKSQENIWSQVLRQTLI